MSDGDGDDHDQAIYQALRELARDRLRAAPPDATLGTTQLVHESWLRLQPHLPDAPDDRAAFLLRAGRVIRAVIVDVALHRLEEGRGELATGSAVRIDGEPVAPDDGPEVEILRIHDALHELEKVDLRMADIDGAIGRAHLGLGQPALALPALLKADACWRGRDATHPAARDAARWLARAREGTERTPRSKAAAPARSPGSAGRP